MLETEIEKYYFSYDNGWTFDNQSWDSYCGPYFAAGSFLVLLRRASLVLVLHWFPRPEIPKELFRGELLDAQELEDLMRKIEVYRTEYCVINGIDPEVDVESDLVRRQNGESDRPARRLARIPQ